MILNLTTFSHNQSYLVIIGHIQSRPQQIVQTPYLKGQIMVTKELFIFVFDKSFWKKKQFEIEIMYYKYVVRKVDIIFDLF